MKTAASNQRQRLLTLLTWALLLLLAWGLWLWRLDAGDLTFDETATYSVAHRSLPKILTYLQKAVREHPPVYYFLIHVWMELTGVSEFSMRIFSVGAGMVALTLMGWLGRLTLGSSASYAGLLPALLFAFTPGAAYCVRDARMYSMEIVWVLLSAGLFLRDWLPKKKGPRRIAIASLAAVHCLALLTHYYVLLIILAQPITLLLARRWRSLLKWCVVHIFPALAALTWFWLSPGLQMTTSSLLPHLALTAPTRSQVLQLLDRILFSPVISNRTHLLYWLLASILGGILLALWRRWTVGMWLALALTMPLTLVYIIPHPPAPRYLTFLIPIAALALSYLCVLPQYLKRRWLAGGATWALALLGTQLLIAGGLHNALSFNRSSYGQILEIIQAHARPNDGLLLYGPWQMIQFEYYDPGGMPPTEMLPRYAPPVLKPAEAEPVLNKLLANHDRLWVIPAAVDDVDPPHFVEGWLRTHAHRVWDTTHFSLYLPPLSAAAPSQSIQELFGETLLLESVSWEPGPVRAGDPLRLTLRWRPRRPLGDDVRLTLELIDAAEHVWDHSYPLPGKWAYSPSQWNSGELIVDPEGLMIPWGAPPGKYTVRLRVAEESSGAALKVEGEDEINLLTLDVGTVSESSAQPVPPGRLNHHIYLPLILTQDHPRRDPVLYGLPNAEAATIFTRARTESGGLKLVGYEAGGREFPQAYPIPLTLHWLAPERTLPELRLRLQIARPPRLPLPWLQAAPIVTRNLSLAPTYPAPAWPAGRLVTLPIAVMLPPDAPPGPAQIILQVLGPEGHPWTTAEGDPFRVLFEITIEQRPVLRQLPGGLTPIQADFGAEIGLRGYRVEGDIRPGGRLHITYAWYARTRPKIIYAIFNHLRAADGSLAAQVDGWPQGGRMLTTQWRPGEYVEDEYTLEIPPDAPAGPYTLSVGVYNAANDERSSAFWDGQRLPGDQLPIPLPGEDDR